MDEQVSSFLVKKRNLRYLRILTVFIVGRVMVDWTRLTGLCLLDIFDSFLKVLFFRTQSRFLS